MKNKYIKKPVSKINVDKVAKVRVWYDNGTDGFWGFINKNKWQELLPDFLEKFGKKDKKLYKITIDFEITDSQIEEHNSFGGVQWVREENKE